MTERSVSRVMAISSAAVSNDGGYMRGPDVELKSRAIAPEHKRVMGV
ncbi:MAG: hypothetical protein AAFX86_01945 [Pseudomonadota bacterium]